MGSAELPQCLSIIICDDIYRDEETKKLIIVGTFNSISASNFPCAHPKMSVLFTLTNGHGDYNLKLAIEHAETGVDIVEVSGPLQMASPLIISDFNVSLQNLHFPVEGKYWVSLSVNDVIIMQRPFVVAVLHDQTE